MRERGQLGIIIFVLVMVLVLAVMLLIIFLGGRDEPMRLNTTENKTYYNITVQSNADTEASYELDNGTAVLVKGLLFPDTIERYDEGIEANTTVRLTAYGDDYYLNVSVCNVTMNKYPCAVGLKKKALNYTVTLTPTSVVIEPNNLTIQSPILICWSEKASTVNVLMGLLPLSSVPKDLATTYDFCYVDNEDITSTTIFEIDVHKNPFVNTSDLLKVLVRDYEISGKKNIGDVTAGAIV